MSTLIDCPSCRRKLRVPNDFLGKNVRCPTCGETFRAPEAASPAAAPPAAPEPAAPSPAAPSPLLTVPLKLELDDDPPAPQPAAATPPEPARRAEEAPPRRKRRPEPEEDDRGDERRRGRARRRRDFEPCPRCGDDIRRGAVVCPYCGLDLEVQGDGYTRQRPVRRDAEPHRGGTVQVLGIVSLVLSVIWLFPLGIPLGIAAWVMGRRDLKKMDEGTMDPNGRKKTRDGWLCGLIGTCLNSLFALLFVGIIVMAVIADSGPSRPPPARPPAVVKQPPPGVPQPQLNDFTLGGPALVTLKRGETQWVTVTVDRAPRLRRNVTVQVVEVPDGLVVNLPDTVVRPGMPGVVTFNITAERNADFGDQVVTLSADSGAGDDITLDIPVRVIRGR